MSMWLTRFRSITGDRQERVRRDRQERFFRLLVDRRDKRDA